MRAIVYTRVSSTGQVENGQGLDIQEDQCRAYAARMGWEVEVFREEGVSGAKDVQDRPALTAALAAMEEGDVLLVARLDRLARQLTVQEVVLATVWSSGGIVHSADHGVVLQDDPDDPFRTAMRQMAGVFAQLDRALVVKRMRDGRRRKAATGGKAVGRYPFGWRAGGVEDDREQHVLAYIRAQAKAGATQKQIVDRLNNRPGWQPRSSTRWTQQNLSTVMRNAGIRRSNP